MADKSVKTSKRARVWPGIVFPVGLTLLLVLAAWQFARTVEKEQTRLNDAAIALAGYARMEAGELSRRARGLAQSFVDRRLAARAEQEKNLRVEIRGVMEAVNRVLGASLERNRVQAAGRREVPDFPSGFGGIKNYLELSRADAKTDQSTKALHACAPELGGLLPSGCSLAVIENNALEIFSIGGGAPPDNSLSVAMNREFIWSDGVGPGKHWTLHLKLHAPDRNPLPGAAEIAEHLTREMGRATLNDAAWRGWLVGANGQPVATFPVEERGRPGREPPPFTGIPGEWVEIDSRYLVWLENGMRASGQDFTPAVAVSIARPAPPLDLVDEFLKDTRWICTLGALALGAIAFWIWFFRNMLAGRRRRIAAEAEAAARPRRRADPPPSAGATAVAAELRRRLVRDDSARVIPDVEGIIVADIDSEGGMTVSNVNGFSTLRQPAPPPAPRPVALPSGSLFRLQARHRGGKGRQGARALDRATNPVLKSLAARIRPVVNVSSAAPKPPQPSSRPSGRTTEKYIKKDDPEGWDAV